MLFETETRVRKFIVHGYNPRGDFKDRGYLESRFF